MKFIIAVGIFTGIYVCAMDLITKYTSTIDFATSNISILTVKIDGEVNSPGVYQLPSGATLEDLVAYGGGLTEDSDLSSIDLSLLLENQKKYYIPTIEVETVKVSINTATVKELQTIPGIGSSLAARIVSYRLENGLFTSIEDITNVKGIKEATLEKIKDYITL